MKRLFKKVLPARFKNFKDKASTSCSKFNEVIVNDNAADDDALSNELYDITDDQLQNLEYEEITLYRPSRNTKLGLTLWYENDGDMETNIFVSKIENGSLVDLDGRMHAGDQILQICGMDVHTKNQAVELLTHCNRVAKFLVARSLPRLPVTASMMSTISLPQQELIKPEYVNSVESQRICEEESDGDLMPANQNQFSQEDSGISRLTGDESDSGGVLGNSRNNAARNLRPPASSGIVVRRRLRSTHFDHAANGALDRAADKFVVGKHLSCGDVVSEFDHVTSDFGVRSSPGGVNQRSPSSLPSGRFASENSFFGGGGGASDAAHPSSNTDGHVTSETTLTLDRSGGDVVPPPSTILRAQSARENCFENTPNLHTNYDNMTQMNRSVKLDLMNLRKEMADMQMECDRLIEAGEFFERRRKEEREKRMLGPKMIRQTRSIHVQYPENQQPQRNFVSPDENNHPSSLYKISSNTTSSSAYNTGGDSNPSTSVPTTPQQQQATTTTVKFDGGKISINDGSNRATIYTTRQMQEMANRCSSSPGRPIPMNTVTSTQSAPNVSKIRSTSVALSKNLLSKTFYQTKTVITSEPNNSIKIDPDKKLENRHQNQNVPSHRPTNSISQPSVFIPDRRPIVQISENKKSKKDNENSTNMDQNQNSNFHILTDTANNLGKTILLKQRLLRQAMIRQAYQLKKQQEKEWAAAPSSTSLRSTPFSPYGRFEPKILPPAGQHRPSTAVYPTRTTVENYFPFSFQNFAAQQNRVEWKLKKRADGSRYISRRVIRNKLLKTRAEQINSMRTGISSADDDAYSELKTGRYWTREERKRHFERSKERKRRQEELFRRKMLALAQSSEQTVLRLYQKNQHKRQGHELLDNFTTIQEYLSRDTRTVNDKISLGILTVTTV